MMKAKLVSLCRGDGLVYLRIAVTGADMLDGMRVEAQTSDGCKLPCNWYRLADDGGKPHIAVAVPLLAQGGIDVSLTAPDGSTCSPSRFRLSEQQLKWESRLTYRFRPDEAFEIRDIDERNMQLGIYVLFDYAVYDYENEELVVRVKLLMPFHEDTEVECELLDETGHPTGQVPVALGDAVSAAEFDPSAKMRIRTVSFRIPTDVPGFTLAARDLNHPQLVGFRSALSHHIQEIREKGKRYWFHAMLDPNYDYLFRARRANAAKLDMQKRATFAHEHRFSIVVPLYHTPLPLFADMVESVLCQTYPKWELILVVASPEDAQLVEEVRAVAARDGRVRYTLLSENLGITENTNYGIVASTGDFICFLDHDDTLEPDALFEYACALQEHPDIDLMYCDEDKLNEDGTYYYAPYFKPDFDLEFLRCSNYICHFLCVRKSLVDSFDLPTAQFDGAQDHNLTLRACEEARRVHHVTKVLYHWRASSGSTAVNDRGVEKAKPYAHQAGVVAIESHLARQGVRGVVGDGPVPFYHHVKYLVEGSPLVSIVIPNKDCADYLTRCVQSIVQKTSYGNYEIVIVDNNSVEAETPRCYDELRKYDDRISVITWEGEFNFSKIVNFGVQHAQADYLLLLNNDTEVLAPEWLENMLGLVQQDGVGAVGARLLYPDMTVQHAGIMIPDQYEYAIHEFIGTADEDTGYYGRSAQTHNCVAVTAACMMTTRSAFEAVGGFDEEYTVAYNDVDYCLKLREAGQRVIYEPSARLIHYESVSRGFDNDAFDKRIRSMHESSLLKARWARVYVEGDPFFNPNLVDLYHLR